MSRRPAPRKIAARKTSSITAFRLPPKNFDLRGASDRQLSIYGIPKRPCAETHPKLRLLWEELAERKPRFIEPKFKPVKRLGAVHVSQVRNLRSIFDVIPNEAQRDVLSFYGPWVPAGFGETSRNWCGAYVKRPTPMVVSDDPEIVINWVKPLTTVSARWTVPNCSLPGSAWAGTKWSDGVYKVAVWVGIDGMGVSENDVMQAGIGAEIKVSGGNIVGTPDYYTWVEWYGSPAFEGCLVISPGDLVSCTVCAPFENTAGTAMFANLNTNEAVNYGLTPPPGTSLLGNVAEWIVEDPGRGLRRAPFLNFGQVIFSHCTAGNGEEESDIDDATKIDLVEADAVRATASYVDRSTVLCQFVR